MRWRSSAGLSLCVVCVFVMASLPVVQADTSTARYHVPGWEVTWNVCVDIEEHAGKQARDAACGWNDGDLNIGIYAMPSPEVWVQADVAVDDDNFDSTYWYGGYNDGGNGAWGFFGFTCGPAGDLLPEGELLHIWIYPHHVDEDTLEICLGSQGTVTGVFS